MDNVILIRAALWSKSEPLTLVEPAAEKWAFSIKRSKDHDGEVAIPGITMDDLMRQFDISRVDLLKVDIEGAEKEVFGSGTTSWLDRVSTIAIELHDWKKPGCAMAFYSALIGRNFTQTIRGENLIVRLIHST
jgi:FkbM family methyltransferase